MPKEDDMTITRTIAIIAAATSLSACASVETATRNAPLQTPQTQTATASLNVQAVQVSVPPSLTVSEANRYYPGGDIVWREEPLGDRHAQVKAIFEDGLNMGLAALPQGPVPVVLEVEVTRFHALSEKARYTVGGVHAVQFEYRLVDPETGAALTEPRAIKADFKAFGGSRAINAERNGITQRVRITNRIAEVMQKELSQPGTFHAAHTGLIGAINQL